MRKGIVLLLVLAMVASGCTGLDLAAQKDRWNLRDLYVTSTGTWIHVRIGQFMVATLKAAGADEARYNWGMPYSKKVADVAAVFGTEMEIYEIKPGGWSRKPDKALDQLDGYITLAKKGGDYTTVKRGGRFTASPAVVLPHKYSPELRARCLEVVLRTYKDLAPGVVFYDYRELSGNVDGKECSKRSQKEKNADLVGYIYEVANHLLPINMKQDYAQRRIVQVAQTDTAFDTLDALITIYAPGKEPGKDPAVTDEALHEVIFDGLMKKQIPTLFKQGVDVFQTLNRGEGWDCKEKRCS